jgi:hypothetical protein
MTYTPERRIARTVNMYVRALTAVPIVLICARRRPYHHALVGDQNGGSARVIHSLCCSVGGRPASPRKSHSKSQREAVSGDKGRHSATVGAGQVLSEPSPATPGDAREVTGGQGVAGSNPAVPTQVRRLIRSPGSAFCGSGDQDQGLRSLLTRLDRWSSDRVRLQERAEEARRQEPKPSSPCAQ